MLDAGAPRGMRYYMKSAYYDALSDAAIDALAARGARTELAAQPGAPAPPRRRGRARRRSTRRRTAIARAAYALNIIAGWPDAASSDAHIGWARGVYDAAGPLHGNGAAYVNFLGDEGDARVASAYGEANFARLKELKRMYDPTNVFRYNQNIPTT